MKSPQEEPSRSTKSVAIPRFWEAYRQLPPDVRELARKNYRLWKRNPRHPSVRFKKIGKIWSARIGSDYRALAVFKADTYYWFWIGSHTDYERLLHG